MLATLDRRLREEDISYRQVAMDLGVDPSQLRRWEQQVDKLRAFHAQRRRGVKALHDGYRSQLHAIQEDLLRYIFESREQGFTVSVSMVAFKASELDGAFRRKSDIAKDRAIRRFVKSHGLVHRVHTHESQRSLAEVEAQAIEFVDEIRPWMTEPHRHEDFIINMDQTPIFLA